MSSWRDNIARPPKPEPEETPDRFRPLSKEEQWRFDSLLVAGFKDTQALWIALNRDIDLHEAVALREKTDLAYEILA